MPSSKLVEMSIKNFGCIGPEGVTIALDNIVCLVGANNVGKSTILRAYEAAVDNLKLTPDEVHAECNGSPAEVELVVHIPAGVGNIADKWFELRDDLRLVRSRWTWPAEGGSPTRESFDPESGEYSKTEKAAGLDTVFGSRLPRPFRIGSLEDPKAEHDKLLKLVLEPVASKLKDLAADEESELAARIRAVQKEALVPVEEFRELIQSVQDKVNTSYKKVFTAASVVVDVQLGDIGIEPDKALMKASAVQIEERKGQKPARWQQQGTGSQRALFWSMLEVRSELNRRIDEQKAKDAESETLRRQIRKAEQDRDKAKQEKTRERHQQTVDKLTAQLANDNEAGAEIETGDEVALPGYMLLIDEPETALHPSAVRAAQQHLYSLAKDAGWQVMLSTHHPAFIDPLEDHTTIVRLHRAEHGTPPLLYRSDEMAFSDGEKENLRHLMVFDSTLAEMFFGPRVIIVEGDTELAAFSEVLLYFAGDYPVEDIPLILRARGKSTIPLLVKMLAHFRVDFAVLHDIDAVLTKKGNVSPAFTANEAIVQAVADARVLGVRVTHRCSCPEFERAHAMDLPSKEKPYAAWSQVQQSEAIRNSVREVLDELLQIRTDNGDADSGDGASYKLQLFDWVTGHNVEEPQFTAVLDDFLKDEEEMVG